MSTTPADDRERILRAFDDVLLPLYVNYEAGIAERQHVAIAEKTLSLLSTARTEAKREVLMSVIDYSGEITKRNVNRLLSELQVRATLDEKESK